MIRKTWMAGAALAVTAFVLSSGSASAQFYGRGYNHGGYYHGGGGYHNGYGGGYYGPGFGVPVYVQPRPVYIPAPVGLPPGFYTSPSFRGGFVQPGFGGFPGFVQPGFGGFPGYGGFPGFVQSGFGGFPGYGYGRPGIGIGIVIR